MTIHLLASESGRHLHVPMPGTVVGVLDRRGEVRERSPVHCLSPGERVVLRGREELVWRVLDSAQPGP